MMKLMEIVPYVQIKYPHLRPIEAGINNKVDVLNICRLNNRFGYFETSKNYGFFDTIDLPFYENNNRYKRAYAVNPDPELFGLQSDDEPTSVSSKSYTHIRQTKTGAILYNVNSTDNCQEVAFAQGDISDGVSKNNISVIRKNLPFTNLKSINKLERNPNTPVYTYMTNSDIGYVSFNHRVDRNRSVLPPEVSFEGSIETTQLNLRSTVKNIMIHYDDTTDPDTDVLFVVDNGNIIKPTNAGDPIYFFLVGLITDPNDVTIPDEAITIKKYDFANLIKRFIFKTDENIGSILGDNSGPAERLTNVMIDGVNFEVDLNYSLIVPLPINSNANGYDDPRKWSTISERDVREESNITELFKELDFDLKIGS